MYLAFNERHRGNRTTEITSIGKKWVNTSSNYRFDKDTLSIDGGRDYGGIGMVYQSEEVYLAHQKVVDGIRKLWIDLREMRDVPEGVTIDTINQVRQMLGLEKGD